MSDVIDAYRQPQRVKEGCQHLLGCKCTPPYWLRPPTPAELARWFIPRQADAAAKAEK